MEFKKFIKTGILIWILASVFVLGGCGPNGDKSDLNGGDLQETSQQQSASESVSGMGIAVTSSGAGIISGAAAENGAIASAGEPGNSKTAPSGAKAASSAKTAAAQSPAAANVSGGAKDNKTTEYSITLKGSGLKGAVVFTETDLRDMSTATYTYSFRNKEKNNERQYVSLTGVPLTALLKASGWNGTADTLKISCSDGYSNRYKLSEINGLYSYPEDGGDPVTVPAMLAILDEGSYMGKDLYYKHDDGSPFRLVYGQADYDSDFTKDFNSQGWGYYVTELKVE